MNDDSTVRPFDSSSHLEEIASMWLARRDRGLTPAEESEFSAWLAASPRHDAVFAELERSFRALDRAAFLRPSKDVLPDPDWLVAPGGGQIGDPPARFGRPMREGDRRLGRFPAMVPVLAIAAAIAVGFFVFNQSPAPASGSGTQGLVIRHAPERMSLPDGSRIELKTGARVEVKFSANERHVRLNAGEAHFTVSADSARPFVVTAAAVAVRAVGTAFRVSHARAAIDVMVTEGRVEINDSRGRSLIAADSADLFPTAATHANRGAGAEPVVSAGQRVVIAVDNGVPAPGAIVSTAPEQLERVLSWRNVWLEFVEMPLLEVAMEFNRHNGGQLRVADDATGRVLVTGRFRADGVDAFVRLLESSFGVEAVNRSDGETVLKVATRRPD